MRSEEWFADDVRWTSDASALADHIIKQWGARPDLEGDAFLGLLHSFCGDDVAGMQDIDRVWKKMQVYPHCFELAAVRG